MSFFTCVLIHFLPTIYFNIIFKLLFYIYCHTIYQAGSLSINWSLVFFSIYFVMSFHWQSNTYSKIKIMIKELYFYRMKQSNRWRLKWTAHHFSFKRESFWIFWNAFFSEIVLISKINYCCMTELLQWKNL